MTQIVLVAPVGFGFLGRPAGQYLYWIRQPPIQHAVPWKMYYNVSGKFMQHEDIFRINRNMLCSALHKYLHTGA